MARLRALTTAYADCRFRSRLEARWAVLFDVMGTPWSYEPQGYRIDGYAYLPDFWLPSLNSYFEVKGLWDGSVRKAATFSAGLGDRGMYLAVGDIPDSVTLATQGWSNPSGGVSALTSRMFEWEAWFPPDNAFVQGACMEARSARFGASQRVAAGFPVAA